MTRKTVSDRAMQEISELMQGFRFEFGNERHFQIKDRIERLEHLLSFKKVTASEKEEIIRLKTNVEWFVKEEKKRQSEQIGFK